MNIRQTLVHAVTAFDRKQSTKRGYNIYALGQYLIRVDEVCADIDKGAETRAAIVAGFNGRLADACLRALNLPITSEDECRNGPCCYTPVNKA